MNSNVPKYLSFPKQFTPYKWFKPLLVLLLGALFMILFNLVPSGVAYVIASMKGINMLSTLGGGYDSMDAYSFEGALLTFGNLAVAIPALLLANRIVNARSFSSYSSSRGGFDFGVFFKTLGAAVVIIGIPLTVMTLITTPHTGSVRFSVPGFIACVVLLPLQCVAEEYMFRGFIMQTFGSWIKIPVIPIILQTVAFAAVHPYNIVGVIAVAIMGVALGVITYITNGLEAGSSAHIVNNLASFMFAGFGFGAVSSTVDIASLITVVVAVCLYIAFIIFAKKKLGWFDKVKKDDAAEFNAKIAAKKSAANANS